MLIITDEVLFQDFEIRLQQNVFDISYYLG